MWTVRLVVISASLAIAPAAPLFAEDVPRPPLAIPFATSVGSLTMQMDAQGSTLVVADASRQSLAVYKIDGSQVRLVGVRNLDRDFSDEAPKETAAAPLPAKDVPGQDPPEFARPPGAVRAISDYQAEFGGSVQWNTIYVIAGNVADVFGKLRKSFKDWKLDSESSGGNAPARFKVSKDKTSVEVSVGPIVRSPGWTEIRVTELRPKP